ncbi:HAD-IA family hydrolase [Spirosoma taeanense]|nr:HAD-IA family hydrolase [Spirosoma taeanense]
MDGLLVDSEPHWRAAERNVFGQVGLNLTDEECKRTTGLPIPAVVDYWYVRHPWPERPGQTKGEIADAITAGAHDLIGRFAEPMPGAIAVLEFFGQQGIPAAIASASPMSLIELVVRRLNIGAYLTLWHSATLEARNKPAPDVYIGTARKLGVATADCLAFEDSGTGLLSAHSAGMHTVAVPADFEYDDPKFDLATFKIPSLTAFDQTFFDSLTH